MNVSIVIKDSDSLWGLIKELKAMGFLKDVRDRASLRNVHYPVEIPVDLSKAVGIGKNPIAKTVIRMYGKDINKCLNAQLRAMT